MSDGQRMADNQDIWAGKGFTRTIFGKLKFFKKIVALSPKIISLYSDWSIKSC